MVEIIEKGNPFSVADFANRHEVTPRVVEKDIDFLKSKELIMFKGAKKTGGYLLTKKGKNLILELKSGV